MKKILMLTICLALVPMLFAGQATFEPEHSTATKQLQRDQSQPVTDMAPMTVKLFPVARGETLKYDDGTFDNSLGITGSTPPGPDETIGFATYFVLSDFGITDPRKVGTILLHFGQINGTDYRLYVWDNSGATPMPNSHGTHLYVDMAVPQPAPDVWQEIDLSALDIVLPDTFWVGVTYNIMAAPADFYLSMNTGQSDIHTFGNLSGGAADWTWLGNFGYGHPYGVRVVVEEVGGPTLTFWDFEDGWQGWTHTSGQTFPAAWSVVTTSYPGGPFWTYIPPPDAGDSAFIIDSDATGSGIWVVDTAMSPAVANPGFAWLKWGFYLQYDDLQVLLREWIGSWGSWNVVASYSGTTGPAWDSVDVTAYIGDSIQVAFQYDDGNSWLYGATFDNVGFYVPADHDVGCTQVVSPPEGSTPAAAYDVIGRIQNFGVDIETFDVTANVYDTVGMVSVFSQTVTLTDFPVAGDSNVNFGTVTFAQDSTYYTEIYTELAGDANPLNDTSAILSWTGLTPGDVVFELDAEAITGDIRLLGVEFDGEYFYVTGATDMATAWNVYVIDTAGNLLHTVSQPPHSTGWGWRDIAWDYAYSGPDRIDTLYASVDGNVDMFSVDFVGDSLIYHGFFDGPELPNRALAYDGDDDWFFTASFSNPLYKFNKDTLIIQTVANPGYAMYGSAYDSDTTEGPWVWWHSQDDPGTGYSLTISQMDPVTMAFTGYFLAPVPTMSATGMAGGLSYWSDFRGMDVLFGLNQGTPDHIYGVFVRWTPIPGIEEEPGVGAITAFGFAPMTNPTKGSAISYITTTQGNVSLKVYDGTGRLVETLVNSVQPAGVNTINWDTRNIANGVYFFKLEAENQRATHKLILVK